MKCPQGHAIPHDGRNGQCSPLFCGDIADVVALSVVEQNPATALDTVSADEEQSAAQALAREKVRRRLVDAPKGLDGGQADEYTADRLARLTVEAVRELEWQLRFGSSSERAKAAQQILAATGHGPKESGGSVGALIVIQSSGEASVLPPWKRKKKAEVVDAEATVVEPDEDGEDDKDD